MHRRRETSAILPRKTIFPFEDAGSATVASFLGGVRGITYGRRSPLAICLIAPTPLGAPTEDGAREK
jgi:hypothetical protein